MADFKARVAGQQKAPSLFNCSTVRGWWPLEPEDSLLEDAVYL